MAKELAPAFQFYPADFLSDENTTVMTAEEVGAYWLLCCYCWKSGSLENDPVKLAALARLSPARLQKAWKTIGECFQLQNDRWVHPRLDKEREKQKAYRRRQSDSGRVGGLKRAKNVETGQGSLESSQATLKQPLSMVHAGAQANPSSSSSSSTSVVLTQRAVSKGYVFRGRRLDVSDRMHEIVTKAVGNRAEAADWFALYAEWDDAAVKADDGVFNPLNWLKAKAEAHFKSRPAVPQFCRHRHVPPCANDAACTSRYLREQQGVA